MRLFIIGLILGLMPLGAEAALADKPDDIWTMAQARIIAERCPYASVDERVMAGIAERSRIDLKENAEDRQYYAYLKNDRRDQFWARTQQQMCTLGWLGFGPHGTAKNLLIFHWPPRKGSGHS